MGKSQDVCLLLSQKRQLFEEYANVTRELTACDIDQIEEKIAARQEIAGRIDGTDAGIESACEGDPAFLNAARCRGDRPEEGEPLAAVFDLAREIRGIVERVGSVEEQVNERLRKERDQLAEKIKDSNRGMAANAARYFSGAQAGSKPYASFTKI